ncbi:uncharacterized protein LOC119673495 [Teleopsis dalmanni]|uniref:uncharacterized protein LOC119673495 n=1 Tax=Teleopsis dalmanni TaxID=139649 RepID=UPI0018CF7AAD|nr:uncharacterized protein LOC119673495 [Teleopsis dalmanni]
MASEKFNNKLVKQYLSENLCDLSCLELSSVPVQAIKQITYITMLDLHKNRLVKLGEDFASLYNIKKLDLSHNALTYLPHNFGDLINLTSLSLYSNNLLDLPASIGKLKDLHFLDLRDNAFQHELDVIVGTCGSVVECEKCATRVVQYFNNISNHLNNMLTLKDSNQADMVYYNKEDYKEDPGYICISETDDNCSEISISDMSIDTDTEFEEDVASYQIVKKTSILYIKTEHRTRMHCESNDTPRNSKKSGSESDDDSFQDVSSTETESKESLQQITTDNCTDSVQDEDFCGNDNLIQCVIAEQQEIGELKTQNSVKIVKPYWGKMFVKWFSISLIAGFIFIATYFIYTISSDFYSNKSFSNLSDKEFNWNSPKLVHEKSEKHSRESQIQEVHEEELHSKGKTLMDKMFLKSEETPTATWFERILYACIVVTEFI